MGGHNSCALRFQQAFDTVPHHRLLMKLRNLGFTEGGLAWVFFLILGVAYKQ